MIWLLSIPALWFLGKKALWLYALDATIKQQRQIRINLYPGDVSQFKQVDHRKLADLTHELEELGFVVLGDLLSEMESRAAKPSPASVESKTTGIARVFANLEEGCYATLVSVVTVTHFSPELKRAATVSVAPFRTVLVSISENEADSWEFETTNRETLPFSVLYCHPRQLSHRFIGAEAQELLRYHLAERDDIAVRGNFHWESCLSFAEYLKYEERGIRHLRNFYEQASTARVAWQLLTDRLKTKGIGWTNSFNTDTS